MSNILLETKLQDLKEGDYLFSPVIIKDKGDSKPYIVFSLVKFVKWSIIQDGTANDETSSEKIAENFKKDPTVAKIQNLENATLFQVSSIAEIEKLQKQADDQEAEFQKEKGDSDSTYCWRSLTSGFFKTPKEALITMRDQIQEIIEAVDTSINELNNMTGES
jgi:hypothetical protein